jgi:hypothetical protein
LFFPDERAPSAKATLPINAARATITRANTDGGSRVETLNASNGALTLTLDSTPVFIEPAN